MNNNIYSWELRAEALTKKIHDWCSDKRFFADKIQSAKQERDSLQRLIKAHYARVTAHIILAK